MMKRKDKSKRENHWGSQGVCLSEYVHKVKKINKNNNRPRVELDGSSTRPHSFNIQPCPTLVHAPPTTTAPSLFSLDPHHILFSFIHFPLLRTPFFFSSRCDALPCPMLPLSLWMFSYQSKQILHFCLFSFFFFFCLLPFAFVRRKPEYFFLLSDRRRDRKTEKQAQRDWEGQLVEFPVQSFTLPLSCFFFFSFLL